jgi:hypothetical protein
MPPEVLQPLLVIYLKIPGGDNGGVGFAVGHGGKG